MLVGSPTRQIQWGVRSSDGKSKAQAEGDSSEPTLTRKSSSQDGRRPYCKPTPVGYRKRGKVDEVTLAKELGKLTP